MHHSISLIRAVTCR